MSEASTSPTDLQQEVDELRALLAQSKVPGVQRRLQSVLSQVETELKDTQNSSSEHGDVVLEDAPPVAAATTVQAEAVPAEVVAPPPARLPGKVGPAAPSDAARYEPINTFAWDQGDFNSEWVSVYITLPGVGEAKDRVSCTFGQRAFDLQVRDLAGKSYRLLKDNLDKDIVPNESKFIVKKDKVVIKLRKHKGEYSYDHWTNLTAKKPLAAAASANKDPSAGIMDMMKDLYESGDDNMRKIIGESMLKSQRGEKTDPITPNTFSKQDFNAGNFDDFGDM